MSKKLSISIDDKLFSKLDNKSINKEEIIAKSLQQFFENEEQDDEIVTTLKENIKTLEKQKESLEIDNACFKQQNVKLQKKIDEVAQLFPSSVAVLGKTPQTRKIKKNRWIFSK